MPDHKTKLTEIISNTQYGNGSYIGKNFQKGFIEKIADSLIANGVAFVTDNNVGSKWIPVTERLPEIDQPCLCYKERKRHSCYQLATYIGATFSDNCAAFKSMSHYGCIGATHWMPLPEPPKGE